MKVWYSLRPRFTASSLLVLFAMLPVLGHAQNNYWQESAKIFDSPSVAVV